MITIRLPEDDFRVLLNEIKAYCPGMSNSAIVSNVLRAYLPIYTEGFVALHSPCLTFGETETGLSANVTTKASINPPKQSQPVIPRTKKSQKATKKVRGDTAGDHQQPFETLFD